MDASPVRLSTLHWGLPEQTAHLSFGGVPVHEVHIPSRSLQLIGRLQSRCVRLGQERDAGERCRRDAGERCTASVALQPRWEATAQNARHLLRVVACPTHHLRVCLSTVQLGLLQEMHTFRLLQQAHSESRSAMGWGEGDTPR